MSETKKESKVKSLQSVKEVILRDYSKVVFLYPLFFTSLVLWIIELIVQGQLLWLGFFWLVMLFLNLFVMAFDVSSTKFFVILLTIAVIIILFIFLVIPNVDMTGFQLFSNEESSITMPANFYLAVAIILGLILLIAIISAQFDYWKLERNEAYHKQGLFTSANRYPVKGLRIRKDIPDVFEFFMLRAGIITMTFDNKENFHLGTVLNINKKSHQIDQLLSHMEVEIDQLDKT